jgi:hypothetical protein
MAAQQYQLIFNCTAAQFTTAMSTTLPTFGYTPTQAPIKFTGWVVSGTFTTTATTNTSTALTAITSTAGWYVGMGITGSGFQPGTTIVSFTATTAVLSLATTTSLVGTTVTLNGLNAGIQTDFSFDGAYFLRFFGANPLAASQDAQTGIPQTNLSSNCAASLTALFAATLGAPVPSNIANMPGPAA